MAEEEDTWPQEDFSPELPEGTTTPGAAGLNPEREDCPPTTYNFERIGSIASSWLQQVALRRQRRGEAMPQHGAGRTTSAALPRVCPVCRGAGYLSRRSSPTSYSFEAVPCPRCLEPQLARQSARAVGRWTDWAVIAGQTFETFGPFRSGVAGEVCHAAMAYAEAPQGWFVLNGPGRDEQNYLAAAIANEVRGREPATVYLAAPDFLLLLQEAVAQEEARKKKQHQSHTPEEIAASWERATQGLPAQRLPEFPTYTAIMDAVRTCELLLLVDLDEVSLTPWASERLYLVVNHRYNAQLPTVYTLTDPERLEERIHSRLLDTQLLYEGHVFGLEAPVSPSRQRRNQHSSRRS